MTADYPAEIKIVIFQSVSERQYAKLTNIVQFQPGRSTIFIFDPTNTKTTEPIFTVFYMIGSN